MLVATCTYHEDNDEFHAILQLAKPTDLDSSGNYNSEECVIMPADWDQWIGESDLMIRAGSSTCHFVISDASSYTCIQNLINYSNEGFFMIFTESEDLGNNAKLFAQDIATLNDTTVYSVGATFIATKNLHVQDVDM